MNLAKVNLVKIYLAAAFLTLFCPIFISTRSIAFFIPCLVISFYQKHLENCLWMALGCGLVLDLLQAETRFGIFSLNYVLCTGLLYGKKHHFFGDRMSTLPLMSFVFSALSFLIQLGLLYWFQSRWEMSFGFLAAQFGIQPFVDSVYAFLFFVLPLTLYGKPQRSAKEYFSS